MIASVLYLINEAKLSIYNLSKLRSQKHQKATLTGLAGGSIDSLAVKAFNALSSYRCLNRKSTGPQSKVNQEGVNLNWEEEATG